MKRVPTPPGAREIECRKSCRQSRSFHGYYPNPLRHRRGLPLIDSWFALLLLRPSASVGPAPGNLNVEEAIDEHLFLNMVLKCHSLIPREEGQDLVEYALLVALIALVCITSINNVATAIATVFTNISNSLA